MQSGYEGGSMAMMSMVARPELLVGIGMLDSASFLYLPKMVLDAEVARQCRRVARGIDLDARHVMLDVMSRIGPGGHFLSAKETRTFLREGEHQLPEVFVRGAYDTWRASGVPEVERATQVVEEILATHRVAPLPDGAEARMRAAVAAAAGAMAGA